MPSHPSVHLTSGVRMLSSRAALAAPPTGTVAALLLHNTALAALVAVVGVCVTAVVVLIDCRIRWQRHRSWMNNERIKTQGLQRVAQDHPERVVELPSRSGDPFATAVATEGPAPPAAQPGPQAA
jgi:hypothetical protein